MRRNGRMKRVFSFLALVLTLFIVPAAFAGTNYNCQYPVTVALDGNLGDWAGVEFILVPHDKGTGPAPNDADASIEFAAIADDNWLYVAIDVTDDTIMIGDSANAWEDDSIEVYIDANHARTGAYEGDDTQITILAQNIELKDIQNPSLAGSGDGANTGTHAALVERAGGWIIESAIPLDNAKWNINPAAGNVIGFNIHFNDDDDGGGRDHKLIWSDLDVDDQSWNNPTRFADLTFVGATAVQPSGKLATTWASIKK
jgi:hypothetical protein